MTIEDVYRYMISGYFGVMEMDSYKLKEYVLKMYNSNPLEILTIPTVGCRSSEFIGCLGAIYLSSTYRGALEDESKNHVAELNRIGDSNSSKDKAKEKYDELRDEL